MASVAQSAREGGEKKIASLNSAHTVHAQCALEGARATGSSTEEASI